VKKKAALTLLRLYRKHPAILQPEWADRILSLLDDADMGVTLSVTHLILALLQDSPEDYKGCYPKAVRRLKQVWLLKRLLTQVVIEGHVPQDYIYYGVGVPWLQVTLLRTLQYYAPSGTPNFAALTCRGRKHPHTITHDPPNDPPILPIQCRPSLAHYHNQKHPTIQRPKRCPLRSHQPRDPPRRRRRRRRRRPHRPR
jgi:Adaptin N terminal region